MCGIVGVVGDGRPVPMSVFLQMRDGRTGVREPLRLFGDESQFTGWGLPLKLLVSVCAAGNPPVSDIRASKCSYTRSTTITIEQAMDSRTRRPLG